MSEKGLYSHDMDNLCESMINRYMSPRLNDKSETDDEITDSAKLPWCK